MVPRSKKSLDSKLTCPTGNEYEVPPAVCGKIFRFATPFHSPLVMLNKSCDHSVRILKIYIVAARFPVPLNDAGAPCSPSEAFRLSSMSGELESLVEDIQNEALGLNTSWARGRLMLPFSICGKTSTRSESPGSDKKVRP